MGPRRALLSLKGSKVETLDSSKSGSACFQLETDGWDALSAEDVGQGSLIALESIVFSLTLLT